MSNEPTFTIINRADEDYCIAIRGRKVVLSLYNPPDPYQQWMRKIVARKDSEGRLAFVMVNKATNEAIWHNGTTGPMGLVRYDAGLQTNQVLWSESSNSVQGFRHIRRAMNIRHHITCNNHKTEDGRIVDLWQGTHISQWWKFVPHRNQKPTIQQDVIISCRRKEGFNLTVVDDTVMLALADPKDRNQVWIKEISYGKQVKDEDNRRAFALVNKATGKAIKHGFGPGYLVQLAPFDRNYLDASFLWTESNSTVLGFQEIRMQTNKSGLFDAFHANESDSNKTLLALRPRNNNDHQRWKFQQITLSKWDAPDFVMTASAEPSNQLDDSKPSSEDDAKPSNADISVDSSEYDDKASTEPSNQLDPSNADISLDISEDDAKPSGNEFELDKDDTVFDNDKAN